MVIGTKFSDRKHKMDILQIGMYVTVLRIKTHLSAVVVNTGDKIVITSTNPIIIKAEDYGLAEGVAMLQELAKLPSVATAVPVNFVLTFSK